MYDIFKLAVILCKQGDHFPDTMNFPDIPQMIRGTLGHFVSTINKCYKI